METIREKEIRENREKSFKVLNIRSMYHRGMKYVKEEDGKVTEIKQ